MKRSNLRKNPEVKDRIACIFLAVCLSVAFGTRATAMEGHLAAQVLAEINLARTEPLKFAGFLFEFRRYFQGKVYRVPGTSSLRETREGVAAIDEAIMFLSRQQPLPPLVWSDGLAAAAAELAREQGESGATGHGGGWFSDGMRERIERHGSWEGRIGENIGYGPSEPRLMVMQLLIDDGVSSRGHRNNQFSPDFASAGVACGPHPRYGSMCVIDFSHEFRERAQREETSYGQEPRAGKGG